MIKVNGKGVSSGVATGVAFVLPTRLGMVTPREIIDPQAEILRLRTVCKEYTAELDEIYNKTLLNRGDSIANIFMAYSVALNDGEITSNSEQTISQEHVNAEYAVYCEMKRLSQIFNDIEDEYFRERCSDVENICHELILRLMGVHAAIILPEHYAKKQVVLVAEHLSPEDIIALDKERISGVVISCGNICSHAVIICGALGLPAVVHADTSKIFTGDFITINGTSGEIIVNQL